MRSYRARQPRNYAQTTDVSSAMPRTPHIHSLCICSPFHDIAGSTLRLILPTFWTSASTRSSMA